MSFERIWGCSTEGQTRCISHPLEKIHMHALKHCCLLFVLIFLSGCLRSLHPLYTQDELVFDKNLLGTWTDGDQTLVFERGENNTFTVIVHGKKDMPARFKTLLGKVGDHRFLDLYPDGPEVNNNVYRLHLLPVHTFVKLKLDGDELRLSMLSAAWFDKLSPQDRMKIRHERVAGYEGYSNYALLTGRPEELKKLVLSYAADTDAFPKPTDYRRK